MRLKNILHLQNNVRNHDKGHNQAPYKQIKDKHPTKKKGKTNLRKNNI